MDFLVKQEQKNVVVSRDDCRALNDEKKSTRCRS